MNQSDLPGAPGAGEEGKGQREAAGLPHLRLPTEVRGAGGEIDIDDQLIIIN
jgi:hypothetical protein